MHETPEQAARRIVRDLTSDWLPPDRQAHLRKAIEDAMTAWAAEVADQAQRDRSERD